MRIGYPSEMVVGVKLPRQTQPNPSVSRCTCSRRQYGSKASTRMALWCHLDPFKAVRVLLVRHKHQCRGWGAQTLWVVPVLGAVSVQFYEILTRFTRFCRVDGTLQVEIFIVVYNAEPLFQPGLV